MIKEIHLNLLESQNTYFYCFSFFFYIREYILLRIRVLNLINNKYNGIRINKFLKFSKFNNHQIVITIIYLTCKN